MNNLNIALSVTLTEDGGWASTDGDEHLKLQAAEEEKVLLHDEMERVKVCISESVTGTLVETGLSCILSL